MHTGFCTQLLRIITLFQTLSIYDLDGNETTKIAIMKIDILFQVADTKNSDVSDLKHTDQNV